MSEPEQAEFPTMAPDRADHEAGLQKSREQEAQKAEGAPAPQPEPPTGDSPFLEDTYDYASLLPQEAPPPPDPEPEAPPMVDFSSVGAEVFKNAEERAKSQTKQEWENLMAEQQQIQAELQRLPENPDEMSDEQRGRLAQLQRAAELNQHALNRELPALHREREGRMRMEANQVVAIQRQVAEEYPEYASRVMELAKTLPPDQLSNPYSYQVLVQQVAGEDKLKTDQARRREQMASLSGVGGGRSGAEPAREVSRHEVDVLRRLGLRPDSVRRVVGRLQKS